MFIYIFMKTQFQTPLRKDGGVLISLSPYLFLSWCHEWNSMNVQQEPYH